MISFRKTLIWLLFVGSLSNAYAMRISDLFVSGSLKNFEEVGFQNPSSAKGNLELMFKDIFPQGDVSSSRLERIVADLAREDEFFKELDKLLKLDSKNVDFKQVEQAYIQSVMLSHVKGKNLVCADACTLGSESTAKKVSVVDVSDPNLLKLKRRLGRMSSSQQDKLVAKNMGGSIPAGLGPLEKKQLAFFFLMEKSRSKTQRDFVSITKKLTLENKKTNELSFGANFHKIPSTINNLSDEELSIYVGIMKMASEKRQINPKLSIQSSFYSSIDDVINDKSVGVEGRAMLSEAKAKMQQKNCFFK